MSAGPCEYTKTYTKRELPQLMSNPLLDKVRELEEKCKTAQADLQKGYLEYVM